MSTEMGFDASTTDISSHLPGPHLTRSWHAFSCAVHHEPPLTAAAHSGLGPPPAGRSRRAIQPPSLIQHRSQQTRHHSPEPPPAFVFTSSTAITAASSLLRDGPPPCPGPVLCLSRFLPLEELPPPRAFPRRDSRATGSPVPCKSLNRARALFTPDAAGAVSRSPPGLSQDRIHPPGFDITLSISTLPQGFGFTRLHDPHLTQSLPRLFRDAHHPGS
jgi:hypothetical protein